MKRYGLLLLITAAAGLGELRLGQPLAAAKRTSIDELAGRPDRFVGKIVQVRGQVAEVCQMAGCWVQLVNPASGKAVRIKVNDGEIVFPKESVGKTATAEGRWVRIELDREQALARAKHEAAEQGRAFRSDKVAPAVIYFVQGTGAIVETP